MDVSLNSITQRELACTKEDSSKNTKEVTIDDVLKFIEDKGFLYSDRIEEALKKFEYRGTPIEEIVSRKRSMYQRLSRL